MKKTVRKNSIIKKIVMWTILLFMPMSTYATPIDGITCGDIILMITTVLVIIDIGIKKIKLNKVITSYIIVYIFFIILNSLINWVIEPMQLETGILSVVRYLLYMFFVAICAKYYNEQEYFYKTYKILAIIFAVYAIMQFLAFYLFKIVLPINVLGLPKIDYIADLYSNETIHYYINGRILYRAYSVFIEPAYFATYQIPILYLILNNKEESDLKRYSIGILITIGLIVASTTTGIILAAICWLRPIIKQVRKVNKTTILVIIIGIISIIILANSSFFSKSLDRIITTGGQLGSSIIGRFQNYTKIFDEELSISELLIGKGLWEDTDYLPSYGRIIVSFGVVGLIFILTFLLLSYKRGNKIAKDLIFLILIMFWGTNTLFNISSVLMFSLIYSNMNIKENKRE